MSLISMDLDAAHRLLNLLADAGEACDRHRTPLITVLHDALPLVGWTSAGRAPEVLRQISIGLRLDVDDLRWRRDHLLDHGVAPPGMALVLGTLPRRRPHLDGPFADGPFSRALAGLGPSAHELAALDHLATADLGRFLEYRSAAETAGSPFDWSAGGKLMWEACSGPVPDAGEDACIRHDFIYRNWRRLRDDFLVDARAGDELKAYADDRLGDEVHAAVKHDIATWFGWQNSLTWGLPVVPFLWAASIEPAVRHLGRAAWNDAYDPDATTADYYGDVDPPMGPVDPTAAEALRTWLCPAELCTAGD